MFGWFAFVNEQRVHSQPVEVSEYVVQMTRDTLENWQSEFLQVLWQVAGLSLLLYVGSPQSKEGSERLEAKIDELLRPKRYDPRCGARYGVKRTAELARRLGDPVQIKLERGDAGESPPQPSSIFGAVDQLTMP